MRSKQDSTAFADSRETRRTHGRQEDAIGAPAPFLCSCRPPAGKALARVAARSICYLAEVALRSPETQLITVSHHLLAHFLVHLTRFGHELAHSVQRPWAIDE